MAFLSTKMQASPMMKQVRPIGNANKVVLRTQQQAKPTLLRASLYSAVEQAAPDSILGISDAFRASADPNKLNLGVGAYRTEELKPYVLPVVRKAEALIMARNENKEYLPIEGLEAFRKATVALLLGAGHPAIAEGRVAVVQALSGTGSLRVGAAFLSRFLKGSTLYISDPTWGNHRAIFGDENVALKTYRYYDPKTVGLDFAGMMEDLKAAPEGSVILLHGCAHNPTGIDPTIEQWNTIADLMQTRKLVPFFDVAYQGFATGSLETDAFAPRMFVERGLEIITTQSFSKNLGLYGERVGALSFVTADKQSATRVLSQLKKIARTLWSNPPLHGASIAAEVVNNAQLFGEWKEEMAAMAGRILRVRGELKDALTQRMPERSWDYVTKQIGMFSFTGLTPSQVDHMTNKHAVYMTRDGRISLAGLNSAKVGYLADAMVDSFKNVK